MSWMPPQDFPGIFVLVLQQHVGHRAQPHTQHHIPPGSRNPGLTAPAWGAGHPWHEPPAARASSSLWECHGILAAPGTQGWIPQPMSGSRVHPRLFPARAPWQPWGKGPFPSPPLVTVPRLLGAPPAQPRGRVRC